MAKLYFRYGAMGSSKTANAIMVRHNYLERGQRVLMLKPRLDNRDGETMIASRSGLRCHCHFIEDLDRFNVRDYDCLIVDEAQFLTRAQVERLVRVVDIDNVPVIAYGLRCDFRNELFEGSQWLLAWADTIEEVKTICWCGKKAVCNARVVDGKVAREGEQIVLGGSESYVSLCRRHWAQGKLGPDQPDRFHAARYSYGPTLFEITPSSCRPYIKPIMLFAGKMVFVQLSIPLCKLSFICISY